MVECKTADPRTNLTVAKPQNILQAQVQMGLVREIHILQADAFDPVLYRHIVLEQHQRVRDRVRPAAVRHREARAMTIMTETDLDKILPEGWLTGGYECRYCPFTIACGIERRNLPYQDNEVTHDSQRKCAKRQSI